MFPVYDTLTGNGDERRSTTSSRWVGFRLTGFDVQGNSGRSTGSFTDITWEGIPAVTNSGEPNLGARVVTLIH